MELLSRARIMQLLEPWLNGRTVLDAELMAGGLMNSNYLLRLDGRPDVCVLRIYNRDPAACAREIAVLGLIGRDLPVPRVLYADETAEHGTTLAVLSLIEGISIHELRTEGDEQALAEAAYDAGRTLARFARFPGPPTPYETVLGLLQRFSASPHFTQRVPPALAEQMLRVVERWQPRLHEIVGDPHLVHGDYNSRNVFVRPDDEGVWRVSGVLDWEFALDASLYMDIGNFLRYDRPERPRYEPHFSRGLRDGGMEMPPDWRSIARIMDLPALSEFLTRRALPDTMTSEILELIEATIRETALHDGV